MSELLKARIQERLSTLDLDVFEAERRAGVKRGFIYELLNGKKETIRPKALPPIADALDCDVGYLTGEQTEPRRGQPIGRSMRLAGIAEAGVWRDPEVQSPLPEVELAVLPDPRYDPAKVQLFLVRDDHAAGLGIADGSYVFVLTGEGENVREGDIVLAKRVAEDGRTELSVRVLTGGVLNARPLRWNTPPLPSFARNKAEIIGLVISSFRVFG